MTTAVAGVDAGVSLERFKAQVRRHARTMLGLEWDDCGPRERWTAISMAVRDVVADRMIDTHHRQESQNAKRACYLSAEFLMGRSLSNNLRNLGIWDMCAEALGDLGADLDDLIQEEPDAALGNGGLGRLAACFLDSLATMNLPATGYGIRYDFGLFRQRFHGGRQIEEPDNWLVDQSPWLIERADRHVQIPVYGRVEDTVDVNGDYNPMWLDWKTIIGVPYDMPVVGYGGETVQPLRLFAARSSNSFDMEIFNRGDYVQAVQQKVTSETVSKVLYPNDVHEKGQELRLLQEYFFAACALRDMVRDFEARNDDWRLFPERFAIQLNDTHPAVMVAEMMRMLIDEKGLDWEAAWDITTATCAFTNHTLMPEALETWPVELFRRVLPRHLQIIYEINRRFLDEVSARWPDDDARRQRMSLIDDAGERRIRMANLAMVGAHSINGVAAIHTQLLQKNVVPDFAEMMGDKFNNKTNGITQRRWLLDSNPDLSRWISDRIGNDWITDLDALRGLEEWADDADSLRSFMEVKRVNKTRLSRLAWGSTLTELDPDTMFDIQAKRIHEYKRQLLNALHVVHLYADAKENPERTISPRTVLFAGKAAPGYLQAKRIIEFIHHVAHVVNRDPELDGALRVCYLPDYRVSLAERLIPAADLSEQISLAGMEASGTGNMKFALNGAVTIGTLDGANIEIGEEVGDDHIFIFGLQAHEVADVKASGYDPRHLVETQTEVARVMRWMQSGVFNPDGRFQDIIDQLLDPGDHWLYLADLQSYIHAQQRASMHYGDPDAWARSALMNVARIGKFSSDRTISQYANDIWGVRPV